MSSKLVLEKGYSARGADMGRSNEIPAGAEKTTLKLRMEKLRWVDGDYDQGGAYWGNGNGSDIYCAWSDESDERIRVFVRARSRDIAKGLVRLLLPQTRFYS